MQPSTTPITQMQRSSLSTLRGCAHRPLHSQHGSVCRVSVGSWGVTQPLGAAELSRQGLEGNLGDPVVMLADAASLAADINQSSSLENVAPALAGLSVGIAVTAGAIYLALKNRK